MSWLENFAILPGPPDPRPVGVIEQEILDELEFHIEMRTLDNVRAGMSDGQARQDAVRRFGDFERIHKACRQTLLGERIMLQRVQAVLTVVLLVAVIFMAVASYRSQRANEAAMDNMMQRLDSGQQANEAAAASMKQTVDGGQQANEAAMARLKEQFGSVQQANEAAMARMKEQLDQGQKANEAASSRMLQSLDQLAKQSPAAAPQFEVLEPTALDEQFPNDVKLSDVQRGFRNWSEGTFAALDTAWWQRLSPTEKAAWEDKWLKQLSSSNEKTRIAAIKGLAAAGCKRAVPEVLKIATERVEKNNADRHEAVRALGLLGDRGLVPELVPLTYHYNMNTRLEAQVALVRLTGENFGNDVAAWRAWWAKQGGSPPISEATVAWATNPATLEWADPKKQEEMDRKFAAQARPTPAKRAAAAGRLAGAAPTVVRTVPKSGDTNVDPSVTEIRITYNKQMTVTDGSWSWVYDPNMFEVTGEPRYEADGRTCVLPVKLEPGKTYTIRLNSTEFHKFKDAAGHPAVPYVLQFKTRQ